MFTRGEVGGCMGGGGRGRNNFDEPRLKMYPHTLPNPTTHTHRFPILNDSFLLRRIFVVIKIINYTRNQQSGIKFRLDDDT